MQQCPKCQSNRIHRSRTRTFVERLRRQFSARRLFRCEACGWRGWGIETESREGRPDQAAGEVAPPDFKALDTTLDEIVRRKDEDDSRKKS